MLHLIKLSPEITIKSRVVRRRFTRQLRKNLFRVLKEFDEKIEVLGKWDSIEVNTAVSDDSCNFRVRDRLQNTPGVGQVCLVEKHKLPSMDLMLELTRNAYSGSLKGKSFAVRCKRTGDHSFSSVDIERFVGHGLLLSCSPKGVDLKNPDVTVAIEIRDDDFYIVKTKLKGLGGFPLGCQDSVLSLISGGFDSSVSTYLSIKRGLQTHYCFFSLGGSSHELAVKEIALFLWMKFHSSHRVKFISVPFESVVEEVLNNVEDSQMGVVLKRMMIRAGDLIAKKFGLNALITGESIAQVSSQTLANLSVIDDVSDSLILRPLCTSDKQEIINIAREIGTEDFSKDIPEYCAVISKNPTTKAKRVRIEREEARIEEKVLKEAVDKAKYQIISELHNNLSIKKAEVEIIRNVKKGSIVIDIRHPDEQEVNPLALNCNATIIHIPFYSLSSKFERLTQNQHYLLYCDKGIMSRLHAANLIEQGFSNVSVLDLKAAE
tara:strand:- start:733 stop:2202 length:1470 start_codon:yes stop_codon:yes gene_type:complete